MGTSGNSNQITRQYLDSLLLETRYLDADNPSTAFSLYGADFQTPIMTGALSHLGEEMGLSLARGAKEAGAVFWYGMAEESEIQRYADTGAKVIEIIKPYRERELLLKKVEHAQRLGLLAVGIDIDHPFAPDGSPDLVDGYEMRAMTTEELTQLCRECKLPVILKGVLSLRDAEKAVQAGARGVVLSHHNNRISYAVPPLMLLPEISRAVGDKLPIFVDGEIASGMDAFKALALGAKGVGIGRPLMKAAKEGGAEGVAQYLKKATGELAYALACTGHKTLDHLDDTVLHRIG